jgi:hypothetical protein
VDYIAKLILGRRSDPPFVSKVGSGPADRASVIMGRAGRRRGSHDGGAVDPVAKRIFTLRSAWQEDANRVSLVQLS